MRLHCAVSDPRANCEWYKDGVLIDDASPRRESNQRYLRFDSISHDHDGEYECRCGNEFTKARVTVKGLSVLFLQFL